LNKNLQSSVGRNVLYVCKKSIKNLQPFVNKMKNVRTTQWGGDFLDSHCMCNVKTCGPDGRPDDVTKKGKTGKVQSTVSTSITNKPRILNRTNYNQCKKKLSCRWGIWSL